MKTVQLVFDRPQPNGSGGDLRNLAVAAGLAQLGPTRMIAVQDYLPVDRPFPARHKAFITAKYSEKTLARVMEDIACDPPDTVVIEGVYLGAFLARLADSGQRIILDMHNVESHLQQAIDKARFGWLAPVKFHGRWRAAYAADQHLAGLADQIWVCSADDAGLVKSLGMDAKKIAIVPNPVPSWCAGADLPGPSGLWRTDVLFVGHLGYRPNVVAALQLMQSTLPALMRQFPQAQLTLCGRAPHPKIAQCAARIDNVTLVANPAALLPFYAKASVAIIPLSQGGGTRLKVLEAMALGLPVIASGKAVEGLDIDTGQTYLRADTDAQIVDAVAQLAQNPQLVGDLTAAAKQFVQMHHSAAAIAQAIARASAERLATVSGGRAQGQK